MKPTHDGAVIPKGRPRLMAGNADIETLLLTVLTAPGDST